jgi:hypothetical protein
MPRSGAPQAPQGPESKEAFEPELRVTAKTESNWSTCLLSQFLQVTSVAEEPTILSNFVPHSRHRYSKIGMLTSPFVNISDATRFWQPGSLLLTAPTCMAAEAAYFVALRDLFAENGLTVWR